MLEYKIILDRKEEDGNEQVRGIHEKTLQNDYNT